MVYPVNRMHKKGRRRILPYKPSSSKKKLSSKISKNDRLKLRTMKRKVNFETSQKTEDHNQVDDDVPSTSYASKGRRRSLQDPPKNPPQVTIEDADDDVSSTSQASKRGILSLRGSPNYPPQVTIEDYNDVVSTSHTSKGGEIILRDSPKDPSLVTIENCDDSDDSYQGYQSTANLEKQREILQVAKDPSPRPAPATAQAAARPPESFRQQAPLRPPLPLRPPGLNQNISNVPIRHEHINPQQSMQENPLAQPMTSEMRMAREGENNMELERYPGYPRPPTGFSVSAYDKPRIQEQLLQEHNYSHRPFHGPHHQLLSTAPGDPNENYSQRSSRAEFIPERCVPHQHYSQKPCNIEAISKKHMPMISDGGSNHQEVVGNYLAPYQHPSTASVGPFHNYPQRSSMPESIPEEYKMYHQNYIEATSERYMPPMVSGGVPNNENVVGNYLAQHHCSSTASGGPCHNVNESSPSSESSPEPSPQEYNMPHQNYSEATSEMYMPPMVSGGGPNHKAVAGGRSQSSSNTKSHPERYRPYPTLPVTYQNTLQNQYLPTSQQETPLQQPFTYNIYNSSQTYGNQIVPDRYLHLPPRTPSRAIADPRKNDEPMQAFPPVITNPQQHFFPGRYSHPPPQTPSRSIADPRPTVEPMQAFPPVITNPQHQFFPGRYLHPPPQTSSTSIADPRLTEESMLAFPPVITNPQYQFFPGTYLHPPPQTPSRSIADPWLTQGSMQAFPPEIINSTHQHQQQQQEQQRSENLSYPVRYFQQPPAW